MEVFLAVLVILMMGSEGAGAKAPQRGADERCAALSGSTAGQNEATVTEARLVVAALSVPEYCSLIVKLSDSALRFELRLPTRWNGKLVVLGGGTLDGHFWSPGERIFSPSIVNEGYATLSTNGGHDAARNSPQWLDKPVFTFNALPLVDYLFLAEHRALPLAKDLIRQRYGAIPSRSYFEGCSAGGHDALINAQRFPNDYDGIVARAPAPTLTGVALAFRRNARFDRAPGGNLPPAKLALLENAVLAQCDALDGVMDRIISNPAACRFNAARLRCKTGEDSGEMCLSDPQLATVRSITTPLATSDGKTSYPGWNFGGENDPLGWRGRNVRVESKDSVQGRFSDAFIRYFIVRNPDLDLAKFDSEDHLVSLDLIGQLGNALSADLGEFREAGGRMIIWHGTYDSLASPKTSIAYYDKVTATMGHASADETLELFLAPGVTHCFGGSGADRIDLVSALDRWLENGAPPSRQNMMARKEDENGNVLLTRPMCKYPRYPRYRDTGDIASASSFRCVPQ